MTETKFTKPQFTKPWLPAVEMGGKNVNLSDEAKSEDVENWNGVMRVKLFKAFYDSLVESMKEYSNAIEENIVNPMSSTTKEIGTKTAEIESNVQSLREELSTKTAEIESNVQSLRAAVDNIELVG